MKTTPIVVLDSGGQIYAVLPTYPTGNVTTKFVISVHYSGMIAQGQKPSEEIRRWKPATLTDRAAMVRLVYNLGYHELRIYKRIRTWMERDKNIAETTPVKR